MGIHCTTAGIIISDDSNPSRPPLVLPPDTPSAEVSAAVAAYLPSTPEPNWQEFRRALRDENGYGAAFREALLADPMAGVQLAIGLDRFRLTGDHSDFLEALVSALAALAPADAAHIAIELLALAGRCNLPADFLAALQATLPN